MRLPMTLIFASMSLASPHAAAQVTDSPGPATPDLGRTDQPPAVPPTGATRTSPLAKVNAIIAARGSRDSARIIGGVDVSLTDNPWQVALVSIRSPDNFEAQFCGGSYLGGRWVVTAAHCVDESTSEYQVFSDSARLDATGRRVPIVRKIVHPNYNPATTNNDIALLELASTLSTTPIAVARPADFSQLTSGAGLRVTGWGVMDDAGTASRTLKGVTVPLQTMATCNAANAYGGRVTTAMICAGQPLGGQDSCQGDSGGPATADIGGTRRLVGVVSWGDGCAVANKYGIYTRVSVFADWIATNTN